MSVQENKINKSQKFVSYQKQTTTSNVVPDLHNSHCPKAHIIKATYDHSVVFELDLFIFTFTHLYKWSLGGKNPLKNQVVKGTCLLSTG